MYLISSPLTQIRNKGEVMEYNVYEAYGLILTLSSLIVWGAYLELKN